MRSACWFVLATSLLAAADPARAQLVKSYGDLGAWSVTLAKDPHGDEYCLASTREPPAGPAGYNLSFAVDSNYSRVFLGYQGPPMPTPASLALAADGSTIVDLTIRYPRSDFGENLHLIAVDLPPNMLDDLIFPSLNGQIALTVRAGAIGFSVPTAHFDIIQAELDACAQREKIDDASLN
jgi:hypothetical protein